MFRGLKSEPDPSTICWSYGAGAIIGQKGALCKGPVYMAYGTGSIPPGLNGWHRKILFKARKDPLNKP
ncbi:MAG: hypothetical protein SRB1_00920 [Desulfobacteraceae bacterium Eth-SRB1]|nr:MAG: hypothetical protein SRB1_00920 [Desulfobacteraceae bacterium Eth-SRB1]